MGDTGVSAGSQLVKDVISSQNGGSQEGSDNGNELSEEIDKLQQVSLIFVVFSIFPCFSFYSLKFY